MRGMIETLKPPTDSLYKFLSIIGLVIFLTSVVSPILLKRELNKQYTEFIRDVSTNNLDAKTWKDAQKQVEKESVRFRDIHRRLGEVFDPNSKASLAEQKRVLDEAKVFDDAYSKLLADFEKLLDDWHKQTVQIDYKKNLVEDTEVYAQDMFTLFLLAGPIGLIMSIMGFVLWYRRAQKYEDLVLRKKVEEPNESRIIIP